MAGWFPQLNGQLSIRSRPGRLMMAGRRRAAIKNVTVWSVSPRAKTKVARRCFRGESETGIETGAETAQKLDNPLLLRQPHRYEILEGSDEPI